MTSQAPARWKRPVGAVLAVALLALVWRELRPADSAPSEAARPVPDSSVAASRSQAAQAAPGAPTESNDSGPQELEPLRALADAHTAGDRHRVQVLDSAGVPLGGAFVRPRYELTFPMPEGPSRSGQNCGTRRADAEGWIQVQLWQGAEPEPTAGFALSLQASLGDRQWSGSVEDARLALARGCTIPGIRLSGSQVVAVGRVVDGCSRPLTKALVRLWWLDGALLGPAGERPLRPADQSVITGREGRFEFRAARSGALRLEVTHPQWPEPKVMALDATPDPREVMLHRAQGLRGALALPMEVGDLEVVLRAASVGDAAWSLEDPDFDVDEWSPTRWAEVGSGDCFELRAGPGRNQLRLSDRFVLWEGEVPPGSIVELSGPEISGQLVPLHLRVSGPGGEVDSIELKSAAAEESWMLHLDQERRTVVTEDAFPLQVWSGSWLSGTIERAGGYERFVQLEPSYGCRFQFDLPPGLSYRLAEMRVTRMDAGEPFTRDFTARDWRATVRLPEPGRYRVDYLCPDTSLEPVVQAALHGGDQPVLTYAALPTLAIELGTVELRADETFPASRRLSLEAQQLPTPRALLPGEVRE